MTNFLKILKVNILNSFKINKLLRNKKGKISVDRVLLILLGVILAYGVGVFYFALFGSILNQGGAPEHILSLGFFAGTLFTFLITLSTSNNYLFRSRDFDLLMSMPVPTTTVFASKLGYLLVVSYASFSLFYFPAVGVYAYFVSANLMFWVLVVPTFLLLPLLPITLSSFIGFVIGLVLRKLKYKNAITIIFTLGFVGLIMMLSFRSQSIEEDPNAFAEIISNFLRSNYLAKLGLLAYDGIRGESLSYITFVLLSLIPFFGLVYFIGKIYLYANTRHNTSYVNKKFKMTELNITSQGKALFIKEFKRWSGSSMYVINTVVGPILSLVILIGFAISKEKMLAEFNLSGGVGNISELLTIGLIAIFIFSYGITSTTSSAISIEGKQFWILKSSPLSTKQVFNAKIAVNLIITLPVIVIEVILALVLFGISPIDGLFLLLIPTFMVLYMSYLGLYINLLLPRFDFENDVKVVKQSASVIVSLLFGFAGIIVTGALGGFGYSLFNNYKGAYFLALLGIATLFVISYILVTSHGTKLYKKLS